LTPQQATHVVSIAKSHPELKIMAGYSRRFDKSYRTAKANLQAAVGDPFMVRSTTCDLIDNSGFFVKYAALNGGMFVDAAIHDIDLALFYMGEQLVPKSCFAVGTIAHHPELKGLSDVDNGVGVVEFWGGKIGYFYCSRTQAHGHDVATEIVGTTGKMSVNLVPKIDEVIYADKNGWGHKVQPEYWERFENAFALEANEFVDCVLDDKQVPVGLDIGLKGLRIGWALQESLLTGEVVKFSEKFERIGKAAEWAGKFKPKVLN
jgi:myo-inositol 2-dehydrogenase/D-chiro-inositol 1-dehydrogenase